MTPSEKLAIARARSDHEHVVWESQQRAREREHEIRRQAFERDVAPHLRPATPAEYSKWLRAWLENGGSISHAYDYPMNGMLIALRGFLLPPLYGAHSVEIIVPSGVEIECMEPGHNRLYFVDGPRLVAWTPSAYAWSDTEV